MRGTAKLDPVTFMNPLDTNRGNNNSDESHCLMKLPRVFTFSQTWRQM